MTTDLPISDCWNEIGVSGNGSCAELARHVHCRNCPAYTVAGRRLLDRSLPAGYRQENAVRYGAVKAAPPAGRLTVVLFRLGREWYALPATAFQEVAEPRKLHRLPQRQRNLALGLVNVRGELLVCAAVARLLGQTEASGQLPEARSQKSEVRNPASDLWPPAAEREAPTTDTARLLVAVWAGQRIVFPVAEISGTQRLAPDVIHAPPTTNARAANTFTAGVFDWAGHTVGLLNPETFFAAVNQNLA